MSGRQVRGALYVDQVRHIRRNLPAWVTTLSPGDVALVAPRVDLMAWYPMEAFERLIHIVLDQVVRGETDAVRLWGRQQVGAAVSVVPGLAPSDGVRGALSTYRAFLASLYDFPVVELASLDDEHCTLSLGFGLGPRAEEAALWLTAGFLEEFVSMAGGREALARLDQKGWESGAPRSSVTVRWTTRLPSPRPFLARPRVLVVDDEPLVARGLTRLLAPVADVTSASDTDQALALLASRPFDTVVSDFHMPGRDGLSLLREVGARWHDVKRVLHSGSMPGEAVKALRAGELDECIDKPAPRDVLVRAISTPPKR
ncbi:MAG: response regulator [Myxococcaceae bacterium]|nr:response regulator [Myxococcaceae bacterium]